MAVRTVAAAADSPMPTRTLPLQNGDRLTRAEFERRYEAMLKLRKAELIEGVVHVPSPASFDNHVGTRCHVISWLGQYQIATPGVRGGDNGPLRLDSDN